jgi:UDP-3-O-[3-hydroxymyristoyl] glucosamine N-acyltransferase
MQHPGFFERAGPFSLAEVAKATHAELGPGADPALLLVDVRALSDAAARDLSFVDNRKYLKQLKATHAAACLVAPALADRLPEATAPLLTPEPYRGFALALRLFYPDALFPKMAQASVMASATAGTQAAVDATAELEEGVVIEPGAVVGPEARIGRGSRLAAGAVVGYRVTIGRDCYVGPLAAIAHALIGDRVIVHAGARIGQDGFGFAMSARGHLKVPQIGRVVIQDDVEIGANTTIDRGALKDTIIGEGTKIDNLVQIGHNVVVGRHCVIVAHTGIAGSTELGDFVVMGGQSGTVGHIKIGSGAQVAGAAHPTKDIAPGARVGGTPARPMAQWAREMAILAGLARRSRGGGSSEDEDGA